MTMFGQMEPFYLLWNGGILQLQDAIAVQIAAVLGVLRKSPAPDPKAFDSLDVVKFSPASD